MNSQSVNRMAIVVYSPDFAMQQMFMQGIRAGLKMAEKSTPPTPKPRLNFIPMPKTELPLEDKPAYQLTSEELRLKKQLLRQKRAAQQSTVQGKRQRSQNAHSPNAVTSLAAYKGMPEGQSLVFKGDTKSTSTPPANERIAQMNQEVMDRVFKKMDDYQRPQREKVH